MDNSNLLRFWVNKMTQDPELRKDLFQEAYVAMLEAMPRYDETKGTVSTFLYLPVRHALLYYKFRNSCIATKKRKVSKTSDFRDLGYEPLYHLNSGKETKYMPYVDTREEVLQSILIKEMFEILNTFKNKKQYGVTEVIEKTLIEGQTEREVAKKLGMTYQYVHIMKCEVLEKVRKKLGICNVEVDKIEEIV